MWAARKRPHSPSQRLHGRVVLWPRGRCLHATKYARGKRQYSWLQVARGAQQSSRIFKKIDMEFKKIGRIKKFVKMSCGIKYYYNLTPPLQKRYGFVTGGVM